MTVKSAGAGGGDLTYLAVLPRDQAPASKPWPVIVFLHGSGERGGNLAQVKVHGPFRAAQQDANFPFLIAAPHLPVEARWRPASVMAVVDDVLQRWPVDPNRVYLTGLSLGGHGTWAAAAANPGRFAAIAPISGRGSPDLACTLVDTPIWSFQGALDTIVDVEDNQAMVDAVRACGGRPGLTLYPDVGHDAWTRTYNDARLYAWLLSHVGKGKDDD